MNKELEQYYLDRFDMFSSKGWKDLIEDIEKMYISTNNLEVYNDEKSFYKAKGELSIMKWMMNLQELTEQAFEGLKEE